MFQQQHQQEQEQVISGLEVDGMFDSQRKTANLFDKNSNTINNTGVSRPGVDVPAGMYSINNGTDRAVYYRDGYNGTTSQINAGRSVENISANDRLYVWRDNNVRQDGVMLNEGSTALPYEPYGWVHSLRKLGTSTDTLTTLPADIYADGQSATVGLQGNMSQSGTPTPTTPIQPQECGDRTGNLLDISLIPTFGDIINNGDGTLTVNGYPASTSKMLREICPELKIGDTISYNMTTTGLKSIYLSNTNEGYTYTWVNNVPLTVDSKILSSKVYLYRRTSAQGGGSATISEFIINIGDTFKPYEPYGIEIPILSANITTPVYLGEVETTRKIKKIKASDITWIDGSGTGYNFYRGTLTIPKLAGGGISTLVSNKYRSVDTRNNLLDGDIASYNNTTVDAIVIRDDRYSSAVDWLSANGDTEIWYVLATPTTGTVNEPLRKMGDYADTVSGITIPTITGKDTFDVQTTLKPSEVSLAYTGWHDATVKEWDGSEWQ